jgi:hypothetical protein
MIVTRVKFEARPALIGKRSMARTVSSAVAEKPTAKRDIHRAASFCMSRDWAT